MGLSRPLEVSVLEKAYADKGRIPGTQGALAAVQVQGQEWYDHSSRFCWQELRLAAVSVMVSAVTWYLT